ncbi:hypothetical protein JCM16358_04950 [Halanaerocella petrolearia]
MVGNNKKTQKEFMSEEYLKEKKVPTKQIEVPQRWLQTGRFENQGQWIPSAKLILVDRSPVTRKWTQNPSTGTSSKNEGIIAESSESISFMVGINASAQIDEKNAAKFLYRYNNKPLSEIMDTEIRAMVESVFISTAGKMKMSKIIKNKAQIIETVRNEVISYFKKRGITITVLGLKGDIEYLDSQIQETINKKFKEQRKLEAQKIANQRKIEQTRAEAEAKLEAQRLLNKKEIEKAKAKAKAARLMEESLQFQIRMRELENQKIFNENWDGKLPQYMMGESANLLMNLNNKNN